MKHQIRRRLTGRPEILFAVLYGSAAEGESFRDVDVGLYLDRAVVPASDEWNYAFALIDMLEEVVDFSVDVRIVNDAPPAFRYHVSRGIPLLINDEATYYAFLEDTWREYLDFQPFAMQYLREMQ